MARKAGRKAAPRAQTTAQRLDSIIKSARRIMRKDKGLNGDLDRLPMLTWIMSSSSSTTWSVSRRPRRRLRRLTTGP